MTDFSSLLRRTLVLAGLPLGSALAQTVPGVGIGTTTPNAAAVLDVTSTTQGVLLPRLTLAQRNALGTGRLAAPVAGLLIYQTDNTPGLYAYDGTGWVRLAADNLGNHTATQNLNLSGNLLVGGTAASPGTTGLSVASTGRVGVSTTAPGHPLVVQADANNRLLGFNDNTGTDKYNFSRTAATGSGSAAVPGGLNLSESNVAAGRLFVQDGGNVGIGTTTPGQKLDVAGTTRTTNAVVTTALTGNGTDVGSSVVGIGIRADGGLNVGQNTAGNTVSLGYQAGQTNTGNANTFIGYQAGRANTTGQENTFSGYWTGLLNTTGSYNTFSGYLSGANNTTGVDNTFSGYGSGNANTTGGNNVFSGSACGQNNTTGDSNTFTGTSSGTANRTGNSNTFSGFGSGATNTTGSGNTFSGYSSGLNNATGTNLTALGTYSGPAVDGLTNATALGNGATLRQSNTVVLGNGAASVGIGTSTPAAGLHLTAGNSGPGTGPNTAGVLLSGAAGSPPYLELRGSTATTPYLDFAETSGVDYSTRLLSSGGVLTMSSTATSGNIFVVSGAAGATAFNTTSDQRLKTDVRPLGNALATVLALRGVRYRWNALGVQRGGQAGAEQVGLLAQELEKVYPELVSTGPDGYKAVNYAQLTPVLIEALKEQQQQIEVLKQQAAAANARAATAETQATATTAAFEARLRRLEAGSAQARR
jgi:hypothetical protein